MEHPVANQAVRNSGWLNITSQSVPLLCIIGSEFLRPTNVQRRNAILKTLRLSIPSFATAEYAFNLILQTPKPGVNIHRITFLVSFVF